MGSLKLRTDEGFFFLFLLDDHIMIDPKNKFRYTNTQEQHGKQVDV